MARTWQGEPGNHRRGYLLLQSGRNSYRYFGGHGGIYQLDDDSSLAINSRGLGSYCKEGRTCVATKQDERAQGQTEGRVQVSKRLAWISGASSK
jgi:hypothetical protein